MADEEKIPVQLDVGSGNTFKLEHFVDDDKRSRYALINVTEGSDDFARRTVFDKDQPVELIGNGSNTVIAIPGNIGLEADDPKPKFIVHTEHNDSVQINGAAEIQLAAAGVSSSTQETEQQKQQQIQQQLEAQQKLQSEVEKKKAAEAAGEEKEDKKKEDKEEKGTGNPLMDMLGQIGGFIGMIFAAIVALVTGKEGPQQSAAQTPEQKEREKLLKGIDGLERVAHLDKKDEQDKEGNRISEKELTTKDGKLSMPRITSVLGFNPDKNKDGRIDEKEMEPVNERMDAIAALAKGNDKILQAAADFKSVVSKYGALAETQVAQGGSSGQLQKPSVPTEQPRAAEPAASR